MPDIVDIAVSNDNFTTLVAAVQAAGLVEALKSPGPFTVFAPNEEAFAKLSMGSLEEWLKDLPKLQEMLAYHIVEGRVPETEIRQHSSLRTLRGQKIGIALNNGIKVNQAKVIEADITCENGIIHIIDAVLTMPTTKFMVV